jgi:uncharacterized protein YndB with AHSA1/START domain
MSLCRQQGFIEAPVATVWDLISDVERHPEWWPRVVEVECEGLEEGCTYRQVEQTPFGKEEMHLLIEDRDEYRRLNIRCMNTGTFVRFALTEARGGTFVDGEMGMDPKGMVSRAFDAIAGRRFFSSWMTSTLKALREAAKERDVDGGHGGMDDPGLHRARTASDVRGQDSPSQGGMGDPGLEPGTSSLSEKRSNRLS